jgi:hypothetical protein
VTKRSQKYVEKGLVWFRFVGLIQKAGSARTALICPEPDLSPPHPWLLFFFQQLSKERPQVKTTFVDYYVHKVWQDVWGKRAQYGPNIALKWSLTKKEFLPKEITSRNLGIWKHKCSQNLEHFRWYWAIFLEKLCSNNLCDIFRKKCAQRQKNGSKLRNYVQSGHTDNLWMFFLKPISIRVFQHKVLVVTKKRTKPRFLWNVVTAFREHWVPGLPDFSWYKIPKRGKYTKLPQTILNVNKI